MAPDYKVIISKGIDPNLQAPTFETPIATRMPSRVRNDGMKADPVPSFLHPHGRAGRATQSEDAFLETVSEAARKNGGRLCRVLVDEIARLSPTRNRWRPAFQPLVAQIDGCLARGPKETDYLRGAVAAMKPLLNWHRAPPNPSLGRYDRHHAFSTIVGPGERVPSDRMMLGLMLIDRATHYPGHSHGADEVYLPLSGNAVYHVAPHRPGTPKPGHFLSIPSGARHAVWTGETPVLILWAWTGDIGAHYKIGSGATRPSS